MSGKYTVAVPLGFEGEPDSTTHETPFFQKSNGAGQEERDGSNCRCADFCKSSYGEFRLFKHPYPHRRLSYEQGHQRRALAKEITPITGLTVTPPHFWPEHNPAPR
jgi:hypothetical protein